MFSRNEAWRSKPTRWGILGDGSTAMDFSRALSQTNSHEVVACCSLREWTPAVCLDMHTLEVEEERTAESLLARSDIDAVLIDASLSDAPRLAWNSLEAGKSVLCNPPLSMDQSESDALERLARQQNVVVTELSPHRHHPVIKNLRSRSKEYNLGNLVLVDIEDGCDEGFLHGMHIRKKPWANVLSLAQRSARYINLVQVILNSSDRIMRATIHDWGICNHLRKEGISKSSSPFAPNSFGTMALVSMQTAEGVLISIRLSATMRLRNSITVVGTSGRVEFSSPYDSSSSWLAVSQSEPSQTKQKTVEWSLETAMIAEADRLSSLSNGTLIDRVEAHKCARVTARVLQHFKTSLFRSRPMQLDRRHLSAGNRRR
ncbi:MAG: Gfo/Idh/MocA family oxidoreductase [Fimbriimonadales bacterium]